MNKNKRQTSKQKHTIRLINQIDKQTKKRANQQNKTSKGENQHTNIQINILQSRKLTLAYKQTHRQTHKPTKQTCKQSWQRRVAVEETGYISLPVFVDGTLREQVLRSTGLCSTIQIEEKLFDDLQKL